MKRYVFQIQVWQPLKNPLRNESQRRRRNSIGEKKEVRIDFTGNMHTLTNG